MRIIALLPFCSTLWTQVRSSRLAGSDDKLDTLAKLLLTCKPAVGWQVSGAGYHHGSTVNHHIGDSAVSRARMEMMHDDVLATDMRTDEESARQPIEVPPREVAHRRRRAEPQPDMELRLVSFFRFVTLDATSRKVVISEMRAALERLHARGTVYVASEGINGQLSVPVESLEELQTALSSIPGLEGLKPNVQHASMGTVRTGNSTLPYRKLKVREKQQILTDGLGEAGQRFNWQDAGMELDPADWHSMLVKRSQQEDIHTPLLLDCRNEYESERGTFTGAHPLGTDVFAESWDVLRDKLSDVPREQPIMTFCTGGIRCVKTNAFLEQELGFKQTYRLRDGIHGYLRHVQDNANSGFDSQWQGDNYVFYDYNGKKPQGYQQEDTNEVRMSDEPPRD